MAGGYVPRILLCGDLNSFLDAAGDMEVEILGQISFTGSPESGETYLFPNPEDALHYTPKNFRAFLNGKEITVDELRKILDGAADYIIFDNAGEFIGRHNDLYSLKIFDRFIPREILFRQARRNFYSARNLVKLSALLRENKISSLLDVDNFLYDTDFFMFPESFPKVDAVAETLDDLIAENFYGQIYGSLNDCRFKIYDAILINERSPEEFIDVILETDALSESVLTFARKNSALEKFLAANENAFEKISAFPAVNGNWYLIKKRVAKNFCVYVVTHKNIKLDALPEGYKIIHAGHATAKKDFGYPGDDTGDNISELNLYLNEVTALYWIWKNTSHTIIGLNHYRRFFTEVSDTNFAAEKILSREAAEKILRDFDIIVAQNVISRIPAACLQKLLSGGDLEQFVSNIFRKHIARRQPDYLDAFDAVSNAYTGFQYEIFITRRNVFDAYCEWLFSFLLDVTEEVFAKTNIRQIDNSRKYRIVGIFSERLMTVWLRKNRLRIKKLPVLFRKGI